jgi:hypothetical protein
MRINLFKQSNRNSFSRTFPGAVAFLLPKVMKGGRCLCLASLLMALTLQSLASPHIVHAAGLTVSSTADTLVAGTAIAPA